MSEDEPEIQQQREEGGASSINKPPQSTSTRPSWTSLLNEAKQENAEDHPSLSQYMRDFSQQVSRYGQAVKEKEQDPSSTGLTKDLILQTRAALRYAMLCLANEETRSALQEEAVLTNHWQVPLSFALQQKKCDPKCRVLMARLLSNLVSSNPETATAVASSIPLSPSDKDVEMRIQMSLTNDVKIDDTVSTDRRENPTFTTWVDMMLACASSRDGLAAIVAALYNCILSIPSSNKMLDGESFSACVASNRLLISTLLRQMLPASSVTPEALENNNNSKDDDNNDGPGDSATEWIVRTIDKLCRLGLLPEMYTSAAGRTSGDKDAAAVTPELLVLLHCVARAVHDATSPDSPSEKPFLGRNVVDAATVSSHAFLANQFCALNTLVSSEFKQQAASDLDVKPAASLVDPALTQEAWYLVLEILATSLGTDEHVSMAETRLAIGRDTSLIQTVSLDLGAVVDSLSATNQGRNARELVITNDEQRRILGLVQLLGNVCYRCRPNQDLVRTTIIPFPPPPPGTTVCASCIDRTALHVLLSCTCFSYGCFTLREWAIIALRNVLEGNETNQALVEQLEAQQPMQSAELDGMGLRVDMDPDGKVRVVPLDTVPEENGAS